MKKLNWILPIGPLVFLVAVWAVPFWIRPSNWQDFAPVGIAMAACSTLCFLGLLGLVAWQQYLESKLAGKAEKQIESLRDQCKRLDNQLKSMTGQVEEMRKKKTEVISKEKRLLELAEKLRTKTTVQTEKDKPAVQTTDEVPAAILNLIIENFPKS